jgi:two-component sensor histidine kinase
MKLIDNFKNFSFIEQLTYMVGAIVVSINFFAAIIHMMQANEIWFAASHMLLVTGFTYFTIHYYRHHNLAFSTYGVLTVSSLYTLAMLYLNDFSLYTYFFPILLPIATYLILSYKGSLLYTFIHYTAVTLLSLYAYYELGIESQAFTFVSLKIFAFIVTFITFFGMLYHITISQNYERLKHQNQKKELALSEIHHRIKDNLSIISSLMSVQNFGSNDEELYTVLASNRARIEALSLIHKLLYMQKNFDSIHFESYVDELIQYIFENTPYNITFEKDIDALYFSIKDMQHFGIILTELIENSIRHAFDKIEDPTIFIALKKINDELYFIYRDNGSGCNEASLFSKKTLGMVFIEASVHQLKGKSSFTCKKGLKCEINFDPSLLSSQSASSLKQEGDANE